MAEAEKKVEDAIDALTDGSGGNCSSSSADKSHKNIPLGTNRHEQTHIRQSFV